MAKNLILFLIHITTALVHSTPEKKGLFKQASFKEILNRESIDENIIKLLKNNNSVNFLIEIGINHEEQHQELILMDIKNIFYSNPLKPSYSVLGALDKSPKTNNNEFVISKIKKFSMDVQKQRPFVMIMKCQKALVLLIIKLIM